MPKNDAKRPGGARRMVVRSDGGVPNGRGGDVGISLPDDDVANLGVRLAQTTESLKCGLSKDNVEAFDK